MIDLLKKFVDRLFVGAMKGLTAGIFVTLVAGVILCDVGALAGADTQIGISLIKIGNVAIMMMGIGIGAGVAGKLGASAIVTASAAVAGFFGAYSTQIFNGTFMDTDKIVCEGMGDILTAFIAAYLVTEIGMLISNKTKCEYFIVPPVTLAITGIFTWVAGSKIAKATEFLEQAINWSTDKNVVIMGIVIAVLMGLATTFPISSLALALALKLSGPAAGAATVGCCVNMIGFAVASFKENRVKGFIMQVLGTSKFQMPNIVKNPLICLPVVITSAILGPISITIFNLRCNSIGAGLGSCGFMAQLMTYETMIDSGFNRDSIIVQILLLHVILPAILTLAISEFMRKKGLIKENDMKIEM